MHDFGQAQAPFKDYLATFHQAIELYQKADFKTALERFQTLASEPHQRNPKINTIYIQRCLHYIDETPTHFNGVFEHTTK